MVPTVFPTLARALLRAIQSLLCRSVPVGSCSLGGLGGLVRLVVPFIPGLESADGQYAWGEAIYCSEALSRFKPSVGIFVVEQWVPLVGFLLVFLHLRLNLSTD